jgi:phosphatidylserine/phosphatidylglycerophosphate/cardiolipin synthase-like enzyme
MRRLETGSVLKVRAIAGLHVAVLAWDFTTDLSVNGTALPPELEDLLGFAIERKELDKHGAVIESYMLRGIKRFQFKDQGLDPGTLVPLDEHPVQSFQWGDYTAKPATTYVYRVIPMRGTAKNLKPDDTASVSVTVTTEAEGDAGVGSGAARHDVYFNRGVIGSQAYSRRFPNQLPDRNDPDSARMKWLSRGLYEALIAFIGLARNEHYALRAVFYEFSYPQVARALRRAVDAGADVKIVYDAESSYKEGNRQTLFDALLLQSDIAIARTVTDGIRHNKFMVLLKDGEPTAVWTGSTNISANGIFGHSNVGHAVWHKDVATAYLAYWQRLADNLTPTKLRPLNRAATPTPAGRPPKNSVVPLFSARDDETSTETLQWYANRMAEAKRILCFTVAFNLDELFQQVIGAENDVLRYIVKDNDLGPGETVGHDRDVIFAAGGYLEEGALKNFLAEQRNPFSTNVEYIHDKFLLVDPLSDDPLVVTGSANFSRPSQRTNDENMLAIRTDTRVADIYFGEFMRIFDHHYARYVVRLLQSDGKSDPSAGYLKEAAKDWVRSHFEGKSYKVKRRKYFTEA